MRDFLARRAEFVARIVPENVVGNGKVVAELERWLPAETPPARADGCVPEDLLEPEDEWKRPPGKRGNWSRLRSGLTPSAGQIHRDLSGKGF